MLEARGVKMERESSVSECGLVPGLCQHRSDLSLEKFLRKARSSKPELLYNFSLFQRNTTRARNPLCARKNASFEMVSEYFLSFSFQPDDTAYHIQTRVFDLFGGLKPHLLCTSVWSFGPRLFLFSTFLTVWSKKLTENRCQLWSTALRPQPPENGVVALPVHRSGSSTESGSSHTVSLARSTVSDAAQ